MTAKISITLQGVTPLMMHNVRLANPFDPFAREMAKLNSKRKKTDDDRWAIARAEFEGGIYVTDTGPYVPNNALLKTIINGAKLSKLGTTVERALLVSDFEIPLIYDGPRDVAALWEDESFRDIRPVVVGMSKVARCRPYFEKWSLRASALLIEDQMDLADLARVAKDAGVFVGLLDGRRIGFGRFESIVERMP